MGTVDETKAAKASKTAAAPKKDKAPKTAKPAKTVDERIAKYPNLSAMFFKGRPEGQFKSALKAVSGDKEKGKAPNPGKFQDYLKAIASKDLSAPEKYTAQQIKQVRAFNNPDILTVLGIPATDPVQPDPTE